MVTCVVVLVVDDVRPIAAWQPSDKWLNVVNWVIDVSHKYVSAAAHDNQPASPAVSQAVHASRRHPSRRVRSGPEHADHRAQQCRA